MTGTIPSLGAPRQQIQYLQVFRGFAAIGVLLYHVNVISVLSFNSVFAGNWFAAGHLGVDFFFVLSGFIIWYAHENDFGINLRLPKYLLKRFFRIWPLLASVTFLKFLYIVGGSGSGVKEGKKSFEIIFSSFFMLPVPGGKPLVDVAWTLSHEMLFYLIFALGIVFDRRILIFMGGIWLISILVCALAPAEGLSYLPAFLFNAHNLQFMFGCFACWLVGRFKAGKATWGVLFLSVLALCLGLIAGADEWRSDSVESTFYWGSVFALLIYAAASIEKTYPHKLPAFLILPGTASYSIYLIHTSIQVPAILLAGRLVLPVGIQWQIALWIIAAISLGAGILTYLTLEKFFLKRSRTWISRLTASP